MAEARVFDVVVGHDEDDGTWYVEQSDVPGLHAEAATYDDLLDVVSDLAPQLIAANLPRMELAPEAISLRMLHKLNIKSVHAA
jgi:predicted RNase H-like HicB family nuclease